tara:strand:+ start:64 stop:648 length:585 start_codon:yes stop_codon:yes gene_type:complete
MKIDQKNLDKNVANNEEFWNTFHNMLKAPYAFWRDCSSNSLQEWIDICWNSEHIILAIKYLGEYPILKGEGLVCSTDTGQLITNYRYIYAEGNSLINIPLHNLLHYDIVSSSDDSRSDLLIKYLKNGNEEVLRIDTWIQDEIVRAVRDAAEFKNLDESQKKILELSHYELSKLGLDSHKISMLPATPSKGCFGK